MKFKCINEMEQICFDDSEIIEFKMQGRQMEFTFNGALIKAGNSQNARLQNMYCNTIILQLENAEIVRIMKEGMKYYDADGNLQKEIPDEDVPALAQSAVLKRIAKGKMFTVVTAKTDSGFAYEFGIDVPQEEDAEEVDTFWLCVICEKTVAAWERYSSPAET